MMGRSSICWVLRSGISGHEHCFDRTGESRIDCWAEESSQQACVLAIVMLFINDTHLYDNESLLDSQRRAPIASTL
jgi:hypothetical protein